EGSVIASESSVRQLSSAYHCEKLPISQVKGKTRTIEAYSVKRVEI
ncbi:MAG: hypothetical protein ACD_39C00002G0003, partial [uncultured bacterium]